MSLTVNQQLLQKTAVLRSKQEVALTHLSMALEQQVSSPLPSCIDELAIERVLDEYDVACDNVYVLAQNFEDLSMPATSSLQAEHTPDLATPLTAYARQMVAVQKYVEIDKKLIQTLMTFTEGPS
eukprot:m.26016 g.26016  ORF g.26016 m.26016 type:complete len:125 (-) comp9854_c0_seq1:1045-1419(-)